MSVLEGLIPDTRKTSEDKTDQIQNAVHSIGVEQAARGPIKSPPRFGFHAPVEWQTKILKFDDLTVSGKESIENQITEMLINGWYISKEIICRPYVTVIFWRQKETNND